MKMKADVRLGMEQRATNILQLEKTRDPREKNDLVLGITIQARPGETELFMMKNCRSDRFRLTVCLFGVKTSKCCWSIHSQSIDNFLIRQGAMNNNGCPIFCKNLILLPAASHLQPGCFLPSRMWPER